MAYRDVRLGKFESPHMAGDVRIEYCAHQHLLYLVYNVGQRSLAGWSRVVARCSYDPTKMDEMRALVLDAIDIAAKPLKDRS